MNKNVLNRFLYISHKTQKSNFSSAHHGTIFKIDYIVGCKASLKRYKKIEISDDPELKQNRNSRTLKLTETILISTELKNETKWKFKDFLELNKNEYTTYSNL